MAKQTRPAKQKATNRDRAENPFLEIDALSNNKPAERERLAHLARRSRVGVYRSNALQRLAEVADGLLADVIRFAIKDRESLVRMEAFEAIAFHSLSEFEADAINGLSDENILVQARAAWALGEIKTKAAAKALRLSLPKFRKQARLSAEASLYEIDRKESHLDEIISFLRHKDPSVRRSAAADLAYIVIARHKAKIVKAVREAVANEKMPGVAHDLKTHLKAIQRSRKRK